MQSFWGRAVLCLLSGTSVLFVACGGGSSSGKSPTVTTVSIAPNPATLTIGTTQQFTATVAGVGVVNTVTWALSCGSCGTTLSPGTLSDAGLYATPYPAPASVTITATSTGDANAKASVTVMLAAPALASGPALSVDVSKPTHAISPYLYGMNAFQLSSDAVKAVNLPIDRWGGNATSRYNYKLDVTSSASDWYFENQYGLAGGTQDNSNFNAQVTADKAAGAKTMGTVPVNGWVARDGTSCSFSTSTYPDQQKVAPDWPCGNGVYPQGTNGCTNASGCNITGNDPTLTSMQVDSTWAGTWVAFLVSKFGSAANGGVAIYDLDNEPSWWDAVHRDVHPAPFTYDEVTNQGIAVAKAVKQADPSAEVSGPVMDYWWAYFYSKKDIENGWGSGPCYQPWGNPTDRAAHGGVPFIEYYLQQFKAYDDANHVRLLDYLDLHSYSAANSLAFSAAGDTTAQQARLNSTRVFWDPAYTDSNYPQPNYATDANYTTDCNHIPLQAPQVIPMMHKWVNDDYPGTKLAITEYNWGGQEHINGALALADILGIFGREGLDIGTLWGAPDPATQLPGLTAFKIYRNYDGNNSMFGDMALTSASADQGRLSVYGASRSADHAVTVVVINKTYGDLTATLSLDGLSAATTSAQAFLYSSGDLTKILAQPAVTVTPPAGGVTASTITSTFPAQSITLLVAPD